MSTVCVCVCVCWVVIAPCRCEHCVRVCVLGCDCAPRHCSLTCVPARAITVQEISYIHAEGYAAAEMKHGPIALIDKFMPVVVVAPRSDEHYPKLKANIQEVLARGGCVIAVTEEGNDELEGMCEAVIYIPRTSVWLSPMLTVIPLQLLSYYIADLRKCNVDQPRNLAKSVTVE